MKYVLPYLLLFITANSFAQEVLTREEFQEVILKLPKEKNNAKKADLLYQSARYYVHKEGQSKKGIDSASLLNNQAFAINKKLDLKKNIAGNMLLEGEIAVKKGENNLGNTLKQKALQYALSNNLKKESARIYYSIAEGMPDEQVSSKIATYRKAITLYNESGDFYEEAKLYTHIANIYLNADDFENCLKSVNQAVKIKKRIKRTDGLYKEYAILATNYTLQGNNKKALAYALEAEKIAENEKVSGEWMVNIYSNISSIYMQLRNGKQEIYQQKALAEAKKVGDTINIQLITISLANSLYYDDKFREALSLLNSELNYNPDKDCNILYSSIYLLLYCQMKEYHNAKRYYDNLLRCQNKEATYFIDRETMYHAMVFYLIRTGQAKKAYPYIDILKDLAKGSDNLMNRAEIEMTYFRTDSASGNYLSAMEHLKMYKFLSDSVFNINNARQVEDLHLKYETEKKDKNIKLLNSQNQLQRTRAENAERAKGITLAGIIFSGIVIVLLLSLYRAKQLNNKKLEVHQKELDEKNAFLETLTANQEKLLKEKEWLVKEVHHRVKNNLQMVTSLLYSQSVYLEDDAAKRAVKDSLNRMQAMALIHQKLYQDENTSIVDMPDYINELVQYLRESINTDEQISFVLSIEPVKLDVAQAIPLGLIITESIVNAIKYAFLNGQNGIVNIKLNYDGDNHLLLEISDNGIGLPAAPESMDRNSLGLDLMQGLSKQLNGTFTIINDNGVHIAVKFPVLNKQ